MHGYVDRNSAKTCPFKPSVKGDQAAVEDVSLLHSVIEGFEGFDKKNEEDIDRGVNFSSKCRNGSECSLLLVGSAAEKVRELGAWSNSAADCADDGAARSKSEEKKVEEPAGRI